MGGHLAHGPANRGRRVPDTAAPLFVCEPRTAPRGGVVMVHGIFGLTHEVEAACRRLAGNGWLTVAPFLYHRHGGPVFGESAASVADARAELSGLSLKDLGGDVAAAVCYLAGRGCPQSAIIGLGTGRYGFPSPAELANSRGAPLLELADGLAGDGPWRRIDAFLSEVTVI
jgi:hypothetical protein